MDVGKTNTEHTTARLQPGYGCLHYSDVVMGAMEPKITSLTIVYSTVYSGADKRKHHGSVLLAFVRGIPRWLVNSPHKRPVTRNVFPFDDVVMFRAVLKTLPVLRLEYSRMTRATPWLLLLWFHVFPGHRQSRYQGYEISGSLSSLKKSLVYG